MYFVIMTAISLMQSSAISTKNKHIDASHHYVLDTVERRDIKVDYISLKKITVDPITKGLSLKTFTRHVKKLGLRCIT